MHSATTIILIIIVVAFALLYKEILKKENQLTHLQQVNYQQELHVGMLRTLTPVYLDYRNPNQISGFDYDLLKKLAASLDVKLKITFANSIDELVQKANDGQIDLIATEIRGYPTTEDDFLMTIPYHHFSQQLVYLNGTKKPKALNELSGNLVIGKHSLQSYLLRTSFATLKNLIWQESPQFNKEELISLVANGEIDYTIADDRTIAIMQRIYPAIAIAFTVEEKQPYAWFLPNKGDKSLYNKVNRFIKMQHTNGTIARLERNYFSHIDNFDYVDTRSFIRAIDNTLQNYQSYFETYAELNQLDWRLIAAMSYQESHWNPKAVSSTGVRGMMMLTQSTAESLGVTNRLDPEQSIRGGTQYLRSMVDRMPSTIPEKERIWFALAAYNMGIGHLWDARSLAKKLGKNPDLWSDLLQILPLLSEEEYYADLKYGEGKGYQAIHFVTSIQQYYVSLVGYLVEKENRQKNIEHKNTLNVDDNNNLFN